MVRTALALADQDTGLSCGRAHWGVRSSIRVFPTKFLLIPLPYSDTAVKLCAVPTSGMTLSRVTSGGSYDGMLFCGAKVHCQKVFQNTRGRAGCPSDSSLCVRFPSPIFPQLGLKRTSSFGTIRMHRLHQQRDREEQRQPEGPSHTGGPPRGH